MKNETLEILQMHAIQLLGIQLEGYDMDNIKEISNHIKTPFMNTTKKQYRNELKHFIVHMQSNKIYHYKNSFNVSFLIFKFKKYILLGLIWINDPMSANVMKCYLI